MRAWLARRLGCIGKCWARSAARKRVQLEIEFMERLERRAATELGLEPIPRDGWASTEELVEERTRQILKGEVNWP